MHLRVDTSALVQDLANLIKIPSCNPFGLPSEGPLAEAAMADYIITRMKALGLEVDTHEVLPGRWNIWGRLRGSGHGPTLALAGHMDTVGVAGYDAPFDPVVRDGKIHGRGSCDMKAGLAAYLEVVRLIQASNTPLAGDLLLIFVVDEEHAMDGSKFYGLKGPAADFTIVAEPSQLAICPSHRGEICFGVRTRGVSTHSSMPENGVNAIYHMSKIISAVEGYAKGLADRTPDPLCGLPTSIVGTINGGLNVSSVPDVCEIGIDRRTIPGETYEDVMAEFHTLFDQVRADVPGLELEEITPSLLVPPLSTPQDSPLITKLQEACTQVLGKSSPILPFPGSTDAPNFQGVNVICGPGDLAQCHSLNEYVDIDEVVAAVQIYEHTLRALQP